MAPHGIMRSDTPYSLTANTLFFSYFMFILLLTNEQIKQQNRFVYYANLLLPIIQRSMDLRGCSLLNYVSLGHHLGVIFSTRNVRRWAVILIKLVPSRHNCEHKIDITIFFSLTNELETTICILYRDGDTLYLVHFSIFQNNIVTKNIFQIFLNVLRNILYNKIIFSNLI